MIGVGVSRLDRRISKFAGGAQVGMKWGMSNEGKFAKNLINWNRGYLENGECIKDAQKLGVVLSQYNRKASSGFCTVWVTPVNQRKFLP